MARLEEGASRGPFWGRRRWRRRRRRGLTRGYSVRTRGRGEPASNRLRGRTFCYQARARHEHYDTAWRADDGGCVFFWFLNRLDRGTPRGQLCTGRLFIVLTVRETWPTTMHGQGFFIVLTVGRDRAKYAKYTWQGVFVALTVGRCRAKHTLAGPFFIVLTVRTSRANNARSRAFIVLTVRDVTGTNYAWIDKLRTETARRARKRGWNRLRAPLSCPPSLGIDARGVPAGGPGDTANDT